MTEETVTDPPPQIRGIPEYTALTVMCVAALALSVVFGLASSVTEAEVGPGTDLAWKVVYGAVANFLLLVAVMSGIGAIVLSGVRRLLNRSRTGAPL